MFTNKVLSELCHAHWFVISVAAHLQRCATEKLPKNPWVGVDMVITWSLTERFANPWSKQCTGTVQTGRVLLVVQLVAGIKKDTAEALFTFMVIAREAPRPVKVMSTELLSCP